MPMGRDTPYWNTNITKDTARVRYSLSMMTLHTDRPYSKEYPKSPRVTMFFTQLKYCTNQGSSSPNCRRSSAMSSAVKVSPSAERAAT